MGRVVGHDGQGRAGPRVWIDSLPPRTTTSGADGAFAFDGLLSRTYEVRARAGELIGGPQVIRLGDHGASIVIVLREGAHVLVTVVDAARAPVTSASVRVVGTDSVATTDASGQARITVHPGRVAIEATAEGFAPRRVIVSSGSPGATSRITIVLHAGFEVSGLVVDQDRRPIQNVRIYACQSPGMVLVDDAEPATAITTEDGAFRIPSAVGMHAFIAIDDDHAPTRTPTFDVDGAITDLEIVMKAGGVYSGGVVDADGKPVAQARVYLDTVGALGPRRFSAVSDANGAFEVRGMPRTMATAYAVSDDGVSDRAPATFEDQPELRGQKLTLERLETAIGAIAGVLVDDTGAPVPDAVVNATAHPESPAAMMTWNGVASSTATSTTTNARGELVIPDLPAGDYVLWPGGYDRPPSPTEAAQFVAGQDASSFMASAKTGDTAVRLVRPRAGRITAKVTFADTGGVVEAFKVDVQPRDDLDGAVSGEHGALDVRDLRPGTYSLRISGHGFLGVTKADVRVEAATCADLGTITVERGRTLTGRVVDTAGRGVDGARVAVGAGAFGGIGRFDELDPGGPGAITDPTGAFAIIGGVQPQGLGASPLVVGADHWSYGRSLPVELPTGPQDPPPVTLTLIECGSIAGTVTTAGKPLLGSSLIGAGWPEYGVAQADDNGAFVMSRLPAGPVTLRVHGSRDMRVYRRDVEVKAGTQTDVTIDIPVGTIKLAVDVKPKAGADVRGALLFLFRGAVTFETYAQLSARLFPESQGLARWDGDPTRPAAFERLVPGDYTVCTIPLAWGVSDRAQMKRLHRADRALVNVYCAPARVEAAPEEQTLTVDVPSMAPLPSSHRNA